MSSYLTLHNPRNARDYYAQSLWREDTFYTLLEKHAQQNPEQLAIRDKRQGLNWASLKARVDALADELRQLGVCAGDRISLWLTDRIEVLVSFLACSKVGAACNPTIHGNYSNERVARLITSIGAKVLISEIALMKPYKEYFEAIVSSHDNPLQEILLAEEFPEHIISVENNYQADPDAVAYLAFTSGTTGDPKCVMHSANTLLSNARNLAHDWSLSDRDTILTLSSTSHHIAWVAIGQWLISGALLVLPQARQGRENLEWIMENEASYVLGVPTHAMDILNAQQEAGVKRLSSVRVFYLAGAAIPRTVAEAFVKQGIKPQSVYGMTENSSHHYTHPNDDIETLVTTCGRGGSAYELKIWSQENRNEEVPVGTIGEIGGKGACLMLGYFDNQRETERSFNQHGYFMSGDLGKMDAKGNVSIIGRKRELIIRGGFNIYPTQIEDLALQYPDLINIAVFGVPDDRLGERACMALIGSVDPHDLLQFLYEKGLSKYEMPEWFVQMESFPLTPSGKVFKRELIMMYEKGQIQLEPIKFALKDEA